ncbi:outer membrane porin, OprD family, partial [Acinetobacter baumannii]|nr:outer membrane porin, OprD family [Acinetobacter baumannii]
MKYLKIEYLKFSTLLFICSGHSILWAADTTQQDEDEWKFTLKNAYINRDFDNDA